MFSINTGKNVTNVLPPSRYEVENKFKLIGDISNKLESQFNQARTLKQLFSTSILNLRNRLCEEVKVIFRYAPIEYGLRCEEILWKRNYYDYVKFCKKYRRQISSNEWPIFRMHITSGIGHYQSLLFSFRKSFDMKHLDDLISCIPKTKQSFKMSSIINYNLTDIPDSRCNVLKSMIEGDYEDDQFDDNEYIGNFNEDDDGPIVNELDLDYVQDEKFNETLSFLAHRFFICLGDLARYYVDFFPMDKPNLESRFSHFYFKIASFYYKSASVIEPFLGMPFNQLGTLYIGSYWGLDSLYYYVRCLNSKKPFVGVKDNMRQTFESARKFSTVSNIVSNKTKAEDKTVKEAVLKVILLFSELFNFKNTFIDNGNPFSVDKIFTISNDALVKLSIAFDEESNNPTRSSVSINTETIFKIISIFIILIEQIKETLKENSIEIKFENVKSVKNGELLHNVEKKGNFILFSTYRFVFQFVSLLIQRESRVLNKALGNMVVFSNNKKPTKPESNFVNSSPSSNNIKISSTKKNKRPILATSFSSDFNDTVEDIVMMNQLKSTAMQSIDALFDHSDNEDIEDGILNVTGFDNSESTNFDDIIEKLICIDDDENEPTIMTSEKVVNKNSQTMDQILGHVYTQGYCPVIKFFCDYLQSNEDFLDLLENMDILSFFFEYLFDYLNVVSEFDLKLVVNFQQYVSSCFTVKNENDQKKVQSLMELSSLITKFSNQIFTSFKQKHPLSCEIDYLHVTKELESYFDQLYDLSSSVHPFRNLHSNYSNEQYGYICLRSILTFGVKISLLSLNLENFNLSLENYSSTSNHDLQRMRSVKFIFTQHKKPSQESLIIIPPPVENVQIQNEPLINFNDPEDKEVENACSLSDANFVIRPKIEKKKPTNNNLYTNVNSFTKLSFVMIDPYVYLDNLNFVRDLVSQKKVFLVVPKLATDFLDNIKDKNENAKEASDFLSNEFFRGSRMIRFIRNDDRLELEMLKYPRYQWRRDIDSNDNLDSNDNSKTNVQDLALFYELLEHCHYLLVNKILEDKYQNAAIINGKSESSNNRITLITNSTSKWPSAAGVIAKTYGIDLESIQSFMMKQSVKSGKGHKMNHKSKKTFRPSHPMYFKPIANNRGDASGTMT